ncbi:MAG: deoxyribonuclease IV [Acidimicrobiia bacterium]|nr:deoxyribonuclease IV [Acidimicrobiia bacterium]
MKIGAHTNPKHPIVEARRRDADAVQIFLGNPQSWKAPVPRSDEEELKASEIDVYVHAPYLMNLASPNNRVRIPSRKTLAVTVAAAHRIGALGVIVHGGSVGDDEAVSVGFERWRKALDSFDVTVPILVENTAGSGNSVMQDITNYGPLWDEIGGFNVGVCLDTCHTWAAGQDMENAVGIVSGAIGRPIDLVHANDSRDEAGSNRDRHANFGSGMIPAELILGLIREAGATAIVETPDDDDGQATDIAWLRENL